jgi:hypothetical protein
MKSIEQYKKLLREKGILYALKTAFAGALHIVKWNNLKENFREYRAYLYLRKYYKHITVHHNTIQSPPLSNNKTIWTCWLQGVESAPPIVKKCVESMKIYCHKHKIIVLTQQNLNEYIILPDYIREKYEKGQISPAHYSDIIRTILLIQHGGIWIDSTVLLTEKIPVEILDADFFCFRATMAALSKIKASSWFIVSLPNNPILCYIRDMLFAYWKQENKLIHYFCLHLLFAIAINKNAECRKIWSKAPVYANYKNHLLQTQLLNLFNPEIFENICKETPVHKLTYKLPFDDREEASFYDFLIKR